MTTKRPSRQKVGTGGRPWPQLAALLLTGLIGACVGNTPEPITADESSAATDEVSRMILVTVVPRDSWAVPRAGTSARGYQADYETSPRTRRVVARLAADYDLRQVDGWPIGSLGVHCVVFEVPAGRSRAEAVDRLGADRRVESAQPMNLFEVEVEVEGEGEGGGDPYSDLQHGIEQMQVRAAHRWADGRGVRVAIVDTGVDVDHPDFQGRIVVAEDFVGTAGGPFAADVHGTAVAGVIASEPGNGIGIVGVAPGAELLALRGCWQQGTASGRATCNSFTLAKAISFAVDRRADVINLSLSGPRDALLERLTALALQRGAVVIAAGEGEPSERFPTCVEGVVAVRAPPAGPGAAFTADDLALVAPGIDIITTVPAGGYDFLSGSSLAAAHVTGVTALLLQHRPRMSAADLAELLRETARSPAAPNERIAVVDACAALARVVPALQCD